MSSIELVCIHLSSFRAAETFSHDMTESIAT